MDVLSWYSARTVSQGGRGSVPPVDVVGRLLGVVALGAAVALLLLAVLVLAEILFAAYRTDLPWFTGFDPSGVFGDSGVTVRIVALGDSTMTGPGLADVEDVWVRRLARQLAGDYRVELTSLATGGATVGEVVADQLPAALALQPHVVVVSAGGNDVIRRTPIRRVEADFRRLFDALEESGAVVVVLGLGDLGAAPRLATPSDRLVTLAALRVERALDDAVAGRPRLHVVDIFDRSRILRDQPELFAPDGFHPGGDVHRRVADTVRAALDGSDGSPPVHRTGARRRRRERRSRLR